MPSPTAPANTPSSTLPPHQTEQSAPLQGPPEEEFWEMYNKRLEFPLATVGTVFLHVLVGAVLVYILVGLMNAEDRSNPPLQLMHVGGLDDFGDGSSGSGGDPDQDIIRDVSPIKADRSYATPQALAEARENLQKVVLDDPSGKLPISAPNVKAYSDLDESIRKKLLGVGGQKGDGSQPGSGFDGTPGAGPGGTGADSTRARGLRWILRFRVAGGRDYVAQLREMGAEILIPITSDRDCIIIPDLNNPSSARTANDKDFNRLAGKIQFSDGRRQMVRDVIDSLGVNVPGQPKAFWAFFPKEVEEKLASLEKGYRNKRPEDIEETAFRVTIRGGKYELVVEDQILKK